MIIIFVEIYFSVFKVYSASVGNFCWFTKTWDLVVKQDTEFAVIPYENEAQVMLLFTFTKSNSTKMNMTNARNWIFVFKMNKYIEKNELETDLELLPEY